MIAVAFVLVFSGMWLGITALLGAISGWGTLERAFPDRPETPIETLTMQTARMRGINFNSCLRYDICATGLRVSVMWFLVPFRRPFLVPWGQISARQKRTFLFDYVELTFGSRGEGAMAVRPGAFERMAAIGRLRLA